MPEMLTLAQPEPRTREDVLRQQEQAQLPGLVKLLARTAADCAELAQRVARINQRAAELAGKAEVRA